VTPRVNGPLVLVGRFEIDSGTGRAVDRVEKAVFCRCGHSANKPFCDGSHKRVGFEAP
jgi:CDGSH-type Zn-finger protein